MPVVLEVAGHELEHSFGLLTDLVIDVASLVFHHQDVLTLLEHPRLKWLQCVTFIRDG